MASISSKLQHLLNLIKWIPQAKSIDTLDSPILIDFVERVVSKQVPESSEMNEIEDIRKKLLKDKRIVGEVDMGSGSYATLKKRTISQVAQTAVSDQRKCQLIYHLISYYQPNTILELGTSVGLSTYYIGLAAPHSDISTIEGNPDLHATASQHSPAWMKNTSYLSGEFSATLNKLIDGGKRFDLIFVDGDHSAQAQEALWPLYEALAHDKTIYILDDIYWSHDMTRWWEAKKKMEQFNMAIDLYYFGILQYHQNLRESVDVKILPKSGRWQLGIRR